MYVSEEDDKAEDYTSEVISEAYNILTPGSTPYKTECALYFVGHSNK